MESEEILIIVEKLKSEKKEFDEEAMNVMIEGILIMYQNSISSEMQILTEDFKKVARHKFENILARNKETMTPSDIFTNVFTSDAKIFILRHLEQNGCMPSEEDCERFIYLSSIEYQSLRSFPMLFENPQAVTTRMHDLMSRAMQKNTKNKEF